MRTYAAYLRIYEPVSAFHQPDRSRWAAYAASSARPQRCDWLTIEHPVAWFVPFAATERWFSLGPGRVRPSAVAMYKRAHSRWRAFAEFEMAN